MAVFDEFGERNFSMFRCFLKIAVAAGITIKRFFVLLQRFPIYLQEPYLAIQAILPCLIDLMRLFLSHLDSELFPSLVEVPVELHRFVGDLAEHCFLPQDAERADGASGWIALNLQAKQMVGEAACGALKKAGLLYGLLPSADALDILVVDEARSSAVQRLSEDVLGRLFRFLMAATQKGQKIRRRIREVLRRRLRLHCEARNIVDISSRLGLRWRFVFQDVGIAFLGLNLRVVRGLREGKHRVHGRLHSRRNVVVHRRCHGWVRKQKIIDFLRRRDLGLLMALGIMPAVAWANRRLPINLQKFEVELLHLLRTIERRRNFLDLLLSEVDLLALPVLRVLVPNADEQLMHLLCEVGPERPELGQLEVIHVAVSR